MDKLVLEPFTFDHVYCVRVCRDPSKRSATVNLIFHGFPSRKTKNLDLAQELCWRTGDDGLILHYPGLGKSPGPFSFVASVTKSLEFVKTEVLPRYEKINLIGHSWGGLVSLNVSELLGEKLGKMLLFSPFNAIPKDEELKIFVSHLMKTVQIEYWGSTHENSCAEIETLRLQYNPRDIAKKMKWKPNQVTILQAINDEPVPERTTREFARLFDLPCKYEEMDIDHSFITEREKLYLRMFEAFNV
ncbi:MAG: hypothetical protein AB7H97_21430 [Pseudobdellovibrionaceae bacterium]